MITFTDPIGNTFTLSTFPKKIISIVPSQTELLFDLGLTDEVIGITKFCVHPLKWHQEKIRVGGTKNLNIEKIKALHPDIVFANKEENTEAQVEEIKKYFPVYTSNISTLKDALFMINELGEITNTQTKANQIAATVELNFSLLNKINKKLNCLYLIWDHPYMSVGKDTFIDTMLNHCGFINCIKNHSRYPILTAAEISLLQPDVIFLSSEPFPFKEKHKTPLHKIAPEAKIIFVDGEYFSWYGSRLMHAPKYFKKLIEQVESEL